MLHTVPVAMLREKVDDQDILFMERAFKLAERAHPRQTNPNPIVGALIARGRKVVATGYHAHRGAIHAEAMALESAGSHASGATMYTTLEPCSYRGADKRTPPCVDAIINAGITRVVVGALDPHARENGRGIEILKRHNICVALADMYDRFTYQNEGYVVRMRHGRPLLEVKLAQTVDGYSADSFRNSQWISDEGARKFAHHLRFRHHAILVGANTARIDNPMLSARFGLDYCPIRIVLDNSLSLSLSLKLFQTAGDIPTYLVHDPKRRTDRTAQLDACNVKRIALDSSTNNFYAQLFSYICREHICDSILIEGGSRIVSDLLAAEMWDKLSLVIAPTLLMNGHHIKSRQSRRMSEMIKLDKQVWRALTDFESQCMVLRGYQSCMRSFGIATNRYSGNWDV